MSRRRSSAASLRRYVSCSISTARVNSQRPKVTNVKIPFSSLPGFRADFWKGKKIVFVSDFQLGNVYRKNFTARVVKKIKALDPVCGVHRRRSL